MAANLGGEFWRRLFTRITLFSCGESRRQFFWQVILGVTTLSNDDSIYYQQFLAGTFLRNDNSDGSVTTALMIMDSYLMATTLYDGDGSFGDFDSLAAILCGNFGRRFFLFGTIWRRQFSGGYIWAATIWVATIWVLVAILCG